jgi:hypothetical protein
MASTMMTIWLGVRVIKYCFRMVLTSDPMKLLPTAWLDYQKLPA